MSKPKKPGSTDIRMVEEDSSRTANGLLVQVPDETSFKGVGFVRLSKRLCATRLHLNWRMPGRTPPKLISA
jgi:hypothetical protein